MKQFVAIVVVSVVIALDVFIFFVIMTKPTAKDSQEERTTRAERMRDEFRMKMQSPVAKVRKNRTRTETRDPRAGPAPQLETRAHELAVCTGFWAVIGRKVAIFRTFFHIFSNSSFLLKIFLLIGNKCASEHEVTALN